MEEDPEKALTHKLDNLRRDISTSYDAELNSFKVRHILHMIDARDITGLYETLTPEALHKHGLLELGDGLPHDVRLALCQAGDAQKLCVLQLCLHVDLLWSRNILCGSGGVEGRADPAALIGHCEHAAIV